MNINRCGWLLLAVLFFSPAVNGEAKTCFTPLYYSAMFEPTALQAEAGGNPNLVAESDLVAATGKSPHGEEGCMCGLNNGRFDLLLRNAESVDPDRRPLSFRILSVGIAFQDKEGTVSDRAVRIEGARIDNCFGTPLPLEAYRSFDDARGQSKKPHILEPGEGVMGCICIAAKDRHRSGAVRIEVAYEPVVPEADDAEAPGGEPSFVSAGPAAVRVFQAHVQSVSGGDPSETPPAPATPTAPCCSDQQ